MSSLVDTLGSRAIGVVESVNANTITVQLEPTAPQATALNTGTPTGFPRINGYLIIPNEAGATVGLISSVHVERSPFPKRKGMQDFGLVDLPFPTRFASLIPLGTLVTKSNDSKELDFEVRRGVDVFPSVGDVVLLPTENQLNVLVEGEREISSGQIMIGVCPTARRAPVHVNPDKLFGRHLAVLGNTGAGKSCTVAGLVRWSLEAAQKECGNGKPNARFIILDPNGEYGRAFSDLNPRVFQVENSDSNKQLKVPAWLWNGEEWSAFTNAAPGVQRPILFDALRRLKTGAAEPDAYETTIRTRVKRYRTELLRRVQDSDHMRPGVREGFADFLKKIADDFEALIQTDEDTLNTRLESVCSIARDLEQDTCNPPNPKGEIWHNSFSESGIDRVREALDSVGQLLGITDEDKAISEDIPRYFPVKELPGFVEALAVDSDGRDVSQFIDSLNLRIKALFAAGPLESIANPSEAGSFTLEHWLNEYIGRDKAENGPIAVIDLSLVPSEVVHVVVAVLSRMVFEAVQRHRRLTNYELPTVLVLDEAHTFINEELASDSSDSAARTCCRTIERIAREGRKFGLGLVLASQRPSEISPTVLSQCNTFLLHRIVNDRDQNLVKRLVPDGLSDMLREIPSLPSRRAILLGWGAPAPLIVEIGELPEEQRPHSPDPAFWDVWTHKQDCKITWDKVSLAWVTSQQASDADRHTSEPADDTTGTSDDG